MILMSEPLQGFSSKTSFDTPPCDEFEREYRAALQEFGAFFSAVKELFGPLAAAESSKYWIELAEEFLPRSITHRPDWRSITIQAASRLAELQGQRSVCTGIRKNADITDANEDFVAIDANPLHCRATRIIAPNLSACDGHPISESPMRRICSQ